MDDGADYTLNMLNTWRKIITEVMKKNNETWDNVVAQTLSDELLSGGCGFPFTLWTENYVYFPIMVQGRYYVYGELAAPREWVGSAPRNPCEIATNHLGL